MATFEYLHIWIPAAEEDEDDEEDEILYPYGSIQTELNRLGQQGWELVNMTPHWEWTYDSIDVGHEYSSIPGTEPPEYEAEAPYSVPDYISGWYCTFKRPSE